MKVQRFKLNAANGGGLHANGEFVKFQDYENLVTALKLAQSALAKSSPAVASAWEEFQTAELAVAVALDAA